MAVLMVVALMVAAAMMGRGLRGGGAATYRALSAQFV